MKIEIFTNDYMVNYTENNKLNSLTHMSLSHFKKIVSSDEHFYILRGEPLLNPRITDFLKHLEGKKYLLTTHGNNKQILTNYRGKIPYLSFKWDGFMNDRIKNQKGLSDNILFLLDYFHKNTDTNLRIEYILNRRTLDWLKVDIEVFRKLLSDYDRMKQPYFVIYQSSPVFHQEKYTWTPISNDHITRLNDAGLLTKKTLQYMEAFVNKSKFKCYAPQDNIVFNYDGTARPCQSFKFNTILGSIEDSSLSDIIEDSAKQREEFEMCPLRKVCWLAYSYKDNIDMNKGVFDV